ncbi:proton-conducting transporter membrane subunit [Sphingomonas sp. KR1UV-12]|uniref:Proton-conducting transporter membrane subunit n=1 Tax=Sphingomonas aurea TaxID=3063994 RepID=A0ABT9ENW1_9SPHN|nr:hydrogen gas-evolving membrane-bound hydrogenase subunit E [Sphingomonas sp. KR1UV-12]MDP1028343.1 proton-conducting transporter membrane subunit [Sphingomonas sp. KR1UV-12]
MLMLLVLALIAACLVPLVARVVGKGAGLIVAVVPFALLGAFVAFASIVERGWVRSEGWRWAPSLGLDLTFRLDGFSFLFCLLITGIGGLVTIYSGGYLTDKPRHERSRFLTLILLFMVAMLGTVLAENMLLMILFWEATSVLSFLLIGFDSRSPRSRRAAIMALQVTAGGGLALIAATAMIGQVLGTYSMAEAVRRGPELLASNWGAPIVACIMIAAFTKSAQFPFHFWLPNAMQAPTPASAYLHSATMVKLGIYLLARFEPVIAGTAWGRNTLIIVACITMLVAALQALRAESFKSALAYSTIASLGILVLLVGLDGPAASVAMIGFLLAHALYKAALFFCAGSVLHATGTGTLRALGGLRRTLPFTALACTLASLSMAGIPPFLGFISKEFLFEAQLESSWELAPLAVAVLVNAVMVGVAGVITLRPFFLAPQSEVRIEHGESFSLVAPPLLLALAGLVISLEPDWITRVAIRPAVAAVFGRPVAVDVAVWHGPTPMLALSAVVVAIGAAIVIWWRPLHVVLRRHAPIEQFGLERLWERSVRATLRLSAGLTARVEHGDLSGYLATAIAGFVTLVVWALWQAGAPLRLPGDDPVRLAEAAVALVGVAGALAAARARNLLAAMIAVGLTGFAVAITFMLNGAPDLSITQFTVEALIVVLLTALLLVVPLDAPTTRERSRRVGHMAIAASFAAVMFVVMLDMAGATNATPAADWFGRMSYVAGKGHNVVNVILVDFRGFDTLGETSVIAVAALLGASLLHARTRPDPVAARSVHFSFHAASRPLFWLLLAASVVILWRGHDQPGGGFVGGLVAALAFAVLSLARGVGEAARALRSSPVMLVAIGLGLAVASGLPSMIGGAPFLTHLWWEPGGGLPKLGTTILFDLGVYAVVLGAVLTFLFGLQREAAR